MAVPWRLVCYVMMVVNVILMLATLPVAVLKFTRPRAQPSSCRPARQVATPGSTVSGSAPPSPPGIDRNLTWHVMQQAVQERETKYQDAEYYRTKQPQGQRPFAHVVLGDCRNCTRDETLPWNAQHPQSTLQGVEYDQRGYLRVPDEGFYFVFAHLHYMDMEKYRLDRDRLKDSISRTEKRFVDDPARRTRMMKKLLFNEQSPCIVVGNSQVLPCSYQGAVVYLKRDDMLSVSSNLAENLHPKSARSYFGVYLV